MKSFDSSPQTTRALTRRSFVAAAGAAGAVLAGVGVLRADASPYTSRSVDSALAQQAGICCTGCGKHCTAAAFAAGDGVGRMVATGQNALCEKGFSAARLARSSARITEPLQRNGEELASVSWDEALAAVKQALTSAGPQEVMTLVSADDPNGWYLEQLMAELGARNLYRLDAALSGARRSAVASVLGNGDVVGNPYKAQLVVAVSASAVKGGTGAGAQALAQARSQGAYVVLIDSANPNPALYDEWIPVRPGTEGALLTAVAKQVVDSGLYNAESARQMTGFQEWAAALAPYTRDWAATETGVTDAQVDTLAARIGQAGAATMFDLSGVGALGNAFASSPHTARVAVALAAVIGALGEDGATGWCNAIEWGAEELPAPTNAVTSTTYPLADDRGSIGESLEQLAQGLPSVVVLDDVELANMADMGALSTKGITFIALASTLTPTVTACDYVLPKAAFFEQDGLPAQVSASVATAARGAAVVPPIEGARTLRQICADLGSEAATLDEDFVAATMLAPYGLTPAGLATSGAIALPSAAAEAAPSAIQLTNSLCGGAGCPEPCVWDHQCAPELAPYGSAWLVAGEGACAPDTMTFDAASPSATVPTVSINPETADALALQEGESITIASRTGNSLTAVTHISSLVHPQAIWWDATRNQGFPASLWDGAASAMGFGSAVLQSAPVTIQKAGA